MPFFILSPGSSSPASNIKSQETKKFDYPKMGKKHISNPLEKKQAKAVVELLPTSAILKSCVFGEAASLPFKRFFFPRVFFSAKTKKHHDNEKCAQ